METPNNLVHGQDGWELERYSWDKVTGKARFTYIKGSQRMIVFRDQPQWAGGEPLDMTGEDGRRIGRDIYASRNLLSN